MKTLLSKLTDLLSLAKTGVWQIEVNSGEWNRFNETYKSLGCLSMDPGADDVVLGTYIAGKLFGGVIFSPKLARYSSYVDGYGKQEEVSEFFSTIQEENTCSTYGFWKAKNSTLIQNLIFFLLGLRLMLFIKKFKCKYIVGGASNPKLTNQYRKWNPLAEKQFAKDKSVRTLFIWETSLISVLFKYYAEKLANNMKAKLAVGPYLLKINSLKLA